MYLSLWFWFRLAVEPLISSICPKYAILSRPPATPLHLFYQFRVTFPVPSGKVPLVIGISLPSLSSPGSPQNGSEGRALRDLPPKLPDISEDLRTARKTAASNPQSRQRARDVGTPHRPLKIGLMNLSRSNLQGSGSPEIEDVPADRRHDFQGEAVSGSLLSPIRQE